MPGGVGMRSFLIATATIVAALVLSATGIAQKPPKAGSMTLKASAAQVTYSNPVTLTGKVKGAKAGVVVTLERRAADATAFVPAGTATTDGTGTYTFTQRPAQSSVFRAMAATTPPATSADTPVAVAPLVGLKVSDRTPRKGQRVRFSGTVRPQHDGTRVAIQRKKADGTWTTVKTPLLRDAGSAYSRYSKRFRIRRSGTYRTVIAAHADHAEGVSRERTLTLG
jgi:hypothetical protein